MRLAFCSPPLIGRRQKSVEAEDCCWGIGSQVLPAMLLACASEAKRAGHDVRFIDLSIDKPDVLRQFKPDTVVHSLAWQWHQAVNDAMARICGKTKRVILAVPPGYAQHYAKDTGCSVAYTEPERALLDILAGELRQGIYPNCLADLGPTDFSLVPAHYWQHYAAVIYQVARGCPYRCRFCVWGGSTVTDPTFRMRPAQLVADNLRQLREITVKALGKPLVAYLLAAQLTASQKWVEAFHAVMAREPYPFQSPLNLNDLTVNKVRMLKECGLTSTSVGLEAVTTPMLKRLGKPYTFERALHGLLTMQEIDIKWRAHIRYGVGESAEDVQEAVQNVHAMRRAGLRKLRVDFAPIVHYKGTRIEAEADYELVQSPGHTEYCPVMAHPPDWTPFMDALRQYNWLAYVGEKK